MQFAALEDVLRQRLPIAISAAAAVVRGRVAVSFWSRWCALVAVITNEQRDDLLDERARLRLA